MVTVKNITFKSPEIVVQTLGKVYNHQYADFKTSYKVKRMCDRAGTLMSEYHTKLKSIQQSQDPEVMKAIPEKMRELDSEENQIEWGPLTADEIRGIALSPAELSILEPFVEEATYEKLSQ